MGRTFDSYHPQTVENRNESLITYLDLVMEGTNVVPFNTTRTALELQQHLKYVRFAIRDAMQVDKMRNLLLRAEDAIEVLDGTNVENEELVDDFRAWKGS